MDNIETLAANLEAYQVADIAKIWRQTRRLLGYGVNELAAELNTSGAQISRIESRERLPSARLIIRFALLKKEKMPGVRFLTESEIEAFPGQNFANIAITGSDGVEYYGETDDSLSGNHQYVNDEDGEHIAVEKTSKINN